MNRRASLVVLAASAWMATTARAESLWERRVPGRAFLFQDLKARHIGDSITIVVTENTDVQNTEQRALSKDSEQNANFALSTESSGDFGSAAAGAKYDLSNSANRKFDGSASFRSAREFSDRVTVTVIDVLPNGNLVVGGKRQTLIAGDERTLVVSGIVRPFDISADNAVSSRFVADFLMTYEGAGQEQNFTRQGWFGRALNRVWPF